MRLCRNPFALTEHQRARVVLTKWRLFLSFPHLLLKGTLEFPPPPPFLRANTDSRNSHSSHYLSVYSGTGTAHLGLAWLGLYKTLTRGGTDQFSNKTTEVVPNAKIRGHGGGRRGAAPTLRDAQGSIDAQPDLCVLLGPVDDGVIGPDAQPIVGGQGGHVVTQEKKDTHEGDEQSDGLHVLPVHGQLDLGATAHRRFTQRVPPHHPHPRPAPSLC